MPRLLARITLPGLMRGSLHAVFLALLVVWIVTIWFERRRLVEEERRFP